MTFAPVRWLRRSALYVPGDSGKMLQRSISAGADMLLLNLEDGVSAAKKDEARASVARALDTLDFGAAERPFGMLLEEYFYCLKALGNSFGIVKP